MFCPTCTKLAFINANKSCIKCQSAVHQNIAVICEGCSKRDGNCAVCLKKLVVNNPIKGCNCGKK